MPPKEENLPNKSMTHEEKYSCCQNYREVTQDKLYMAERRGCELADEFTRLEVQIAIILFGLVGFFLNIFRDSNSIHLGFLFKLAYAFTFLFLTASLIVGLIHIKLREFFWDNHMQVRASRFLKWDSAIKRKITYEEAMSFHEGTAYGKTDSISKSPDWTWILQTILLGCAIIILLVLVLVYLFFIK